MHFPISVSKIGMNIGYAAIEDVLHEGAKPSVAALADHKKLTALRQMFAHIPEPISNHTSPRRLDPTAKATQAMADLGIGANHHGVV
jgi:hypothetical protein